MGWFRVVRTPADSARDAALLLVLMKRAGGRVAQGNTFWAKVRLTKLVFDSELRMTNGRLNGFGFFFAGFQHGPSSGELLGLIDDLIEARLFSTASGAIALTPQGDAVATELLNDQRVWDQSGNRKTLEAIDDTVRELGGLALDELLKRIYAITIEMPKAKPVSVAEAKTHFERTGRPKALLGRLDDNFYRAGFKLPADWERTLLILGNPELNPLGSSTGGASLRV